MSKTKSQLRYVGQWPDGPALMNQPVELTAAARRMAASSLEELKGWRHRGARQSRKSAFPQRQDSAARGEAYD
jgi:hypothetical protein